jgi:hypothetical protein
VNGLELPESVQIGEERTKGALLSRETLCYGPPIDAHIGDQRIGLCTTTARLPSYWPYSEAVAPQIPEAVTSVASMTMADEHANVSAAAAAADDDVQMSSGDFTEANSLEIDVGCQNFHYSHFLALFFPPSFVSHDSPLLWVPCFVLAPLMSEPWPLGHAKKPSHRN